jgi:hypothetical protein
MRNVARLKMGYYPLPEAEGVKLRSLLSFTGPASVIDPCVGQGTALHLVSSDAEDRQAHLLSVFGNDSDVGAITAAVHEKGTFNLTFPDGTVKDVTLGEHASCYKGAVTLPGRKLPVRHLLAVSQYLHTNGSAGQTILLRYRREEAWATLVSFLGLPADPRWAEHILGIVEGKKRIEEIDGVGCQPVLISATTEEMLEWVGDGLRSRVLSFPERNGPIVWPRFALSASLCPA